MFKLESISQTKKKYGTIPFRSSTVQTKKGKKIVAFLLLIHSVMWNLFSSLFRPLTLNRTCNIYTITSY